MAPWKQILLKALGVGVGIGLVVAIAIGVLAWRASRPERQKPWDANAITATFYLVDTVGEDKHLRFIYILENHTDEDYSSPTLILHPSVVHQRKDSLIAGDKFLKFVDNDIFLPARQHAQIKIELSGYHYTGSLPQSDSADERKKYLEAVKKYVSETLPKVKGFAAFDEVNRYRIDFPNGWSQQDESKSEQKSSLAQ